MTAPRRVQLAQAELTDAAALEALSQGHISALGVLYDRYQASVFSFVRRATNDASDVEDVVHVTFMTAARAASNFDGRQSCRPWLVGIAARLLHRRKRGMSRWARALRELTVREGERHTDPHRELSARDEVHRLSAALEKLTEPKRIVLLLAETEGLSSEEIASALQIPVGTVWTRLHHARRDLRRLLGRDGES
ncbi:MAG TPA: RNA polymerase sigma factor [Polyangiaceae bacterium]